MTSRKRPFLEDPSAELKDEYPESAFEGHDALVLRMGEEAGVTLNNMDFAAFSQTSCSWNCFRMLFPKPSQEGLQLKVGGSGARSRGQSEASSASSEHLGLKNQ